MICDSTTSSRLAEASEGVIYMYATRDETRTKQNKNVRKKGPQSPIYSKVRSGDVWS